MPQIGDWLARLGLAKYTEVFAAQEVDFDAFRHLSDDDLKSLGLPLGPRRKILAALAGGSERETPVNSATFATRGEAERRQLTVMFVDLVGSTELSQRLDPEDLRDTFGAYQRAVSAEIIHYGGYVAKLMGDGVLAYFGYPSAHEDDAERAIRAGLAAIAALSRLTTSSGDTLAARVGIATGLVVVGDLIGEGAAQEEAVVGEAPNLAARLQTLAEPNSVIVAESTQRLTAGIFESTDIGIHQLKGFTEQVHAWRILRVADGDNRFASRGQTATSIVGRTAELAHLLNRWSKARSGQGQVVLVSGEPGIGKTCLIAATQERLGNEPRALHCFCSPYHTNSAFYPIKGLIERLAGIGGGDASNRKLEQFQNFIADETSCSPEMGMLLAELLAIAGGESYSPVAISPQARKVRTGAAAVEVLSSLAAQQPLLLVVEDVHWIDPTTREWLDGFIDRVRSLPVLLILSFRPEFEQSWRRDEHVSKLTIDRLARSEGVVIAQRIASRKALPREIIEQILTKSEGVPLFVEELTKSALETETLIGGGDARGISGASPLAVPATLKDSLMSRLDRLGDAKELAQTGACIGRAFHHRLIAGVMGVDEAHLKGALRRLEESELVFREGTPPEATYTFKHALIQDTAFESLLRKRRRDIHAKIAAKLESGFPEIVASEPELLAHHLKNAGLAERAVPYWLRAGQLALRRSANAEAIAHLQQGIDLIPSISDSVEVLKLESQLQAALGVALMGARGFGSPEVLQAMSRARVLSERIADDHQLFMALCGEASYLMISGHLREADALGQKCMALAISAGDEALLLEAHHRQWATKFFLGDYSAAKNHLGYGLATYEPSRHHHLTFTHTGHDPGVCCRNYLVSVLWLQGYPDQAVLQANEAMKLAEQVSHPMSQVLAGNALSDVLLQRREPSLAHQVIADWEAAANSLALPFLAARAEFQRGWALLLAGQAGEGVVQMREAIDAVRATGAAMDLHHYLCVLAQGYAAEGRPAEGMAVLEDALSISADNGAKYQYPELLRTKGDLLLRINPADRSAEDWLRLSLAIAREDGSKMLELRAATRLARLYHDKGQDTEARDVLEPVYAWFTEGFQAPDLFESRALLTQLS